MAKRRKPPKRRSGAAKALRSPHLRQRVKPGKRRLMCGDAFSPRSFLLLREWDQ